MHEPIMQQHVHDHAIALSNYRTWVTWSVYTATATPIYVRVGIVRMYVGYCCGGLLSVVASISSHCTCSRQWVLVGPERLP